MSSRRTDRLRPASVASHLGVMVAVAAVLGVLVAGLAIPFAAIAGLGTRNVADSMDKIPSDLIAAPLSQRTRILNKDGSTLATLYDENRVNVPLAKVSPIMRKAIIAIEDYRYYQHGALDLRGTLRAFVTNQANNGITTQGGSSITQQMVKMTLITQAESAEERAAATADTYQRKIQELRYAIAFEEKYSKDWILERYLNIAYFGDGAYGVEAAARHYFSKPATKLDLRESALLAGLVKNPTRYDPTNYVGEATKRRNTVLGRMAELNVISATEASDAQAARIGLKVTPANNGCVSSDAAFFCDYAIQYLLADPKLGRTVEDRRNLLYGGGLTIKTTLDPRFQKAADASVASHVYPKDGAIGGLAMVEPGTGAVRALSQSRPMGAKKKKGQTYLNYVVPSEFGDSRGFQAGSTFKAFVLSAAIQQRIPLRTQIASPDRIVLQNNRFRVCDGYLGSTDTWDPSNSTGSGTFDLYTGTQKSVNTFFAQLELRTGLCEPVKLARAMGVIVPERDVVPPFTLGVTDTNPLTMAGAYATFAAHGKYCEPQPVSSIVNSAGKTIETYPKRCTQVLRSESADAVADILKGVQEPGGFGYNAGLGLAQPSAGKTGTTQSNKSVWFVGFTPNLAAAAMIAGANSKGQPQPLNGQTVAGRTVYGAAGSSLAGPIWGDAMKVIQQWLPDESFTPPGAQAVSGVTTTIPSLYGQNPSEAARRLREAGFNPVVGPSVDSSNSAGTVAYLSPGSGTSAPSGTTVTIYVSDGSPYVAPQQPDDSGGDSAGGNDNGNGNGNGRGRGRR